MGCVSLYDLKHHILNRRCLHNDALPASTTASKSLSSPLGISQFPIKTPAGTAAASGVSASSSSLQINQQQSSMSSILNRIGRTNKTATPNSKSTPAGAQNPSPKSTPIHVSPEKSKDSFELEEGANLFKNAFFTIDLDAEPLWTPFLPDERVLDYRVLFALTNCVESDPPICVFNSDGKNNYLLGKLFDFK